MNLLPSYSSPARVQKTFRMVSQCPVAVHWSGAFVCLGRAPKVHGWAEKKRCSGRIAVTVYFLQEQHATMNLLDFKTTDVQLSTSIMK